MRERLPNLHVIPDARLRYLAGRIHSLGERPLIELLRQLDAGTDLHPTLEAYARLPAEFVAAYGGDRLPPLRAIVEPPR
jgi:hypothetical protein